MEEFKQYYKFPLKPMLGLETIKVLTADDKIAFDWCVEWIAKQFSSFIDKINTGNPNKFLPTGLLKFKYEDGYVCFDGSKPMKIMHIRGWGMLTDYPYHLSEEEAKKIQNEFGEYICNKLNS